MFTKLLVPLDGSALAEQALGRAAALARAARAEIDLMLVCESGSPEPRESYLRTIAGELATGADVPVRYAVVDGKPADAICTRALEVGADLIVMTSHGRTGLRRVWAGSVADAVLRHASIPVLMLRPVETRVARRSAHHLFKRIVVLLDGSEPSMQILAPAAELARCSGARVTLLRVVTPVPVVSFEPASPFVASASTQDDVATRALVIDMARDLSGIANTLASDAHVNVDGRVIVGVDVARAALDFVRRERADLVAMITRGRGASRILVGSIADAVLRRSELPVLLLCAKGDGQGEAVAHEELRFALV